MYRHVGNDIVTCYPHVSRHVSINCPTNDHPICSQHVPICFPSCFLHVYQILPTVLPDVPFDSSGKSPTFSKVFPMFQRFHPPGLEVAAHRAVEAIAFERLKHGHFGERWGK